MFASGYGDGVYPAYWGIDARGNAPRNPALPPTASLPSDSDDDCGCTRTATWSSGFGLLSGLLHAVQPSTSLSRFVHPGARIRDLISRRVETAVRTCTGRHRPPAPRLPSLEPGDFPPRANRCRRCASAATPVASLAILNLPNLGSASNHRTTGSLPPDHHHGDINRRDRTPGARSHRFMSPAFIPRDCDCLSATGCAAPLRFSRRLAPASAQRRCEIIGKSEPQTWRRFRDSRWVHQPSMDVNSPLDFTARCAPSRSCSAFAPPPP